MLCVYFINIWSGKEGNEPALCFQRWLSSAVDKDRPGHGGAAEGGVWAGGLHVAVPAPLREGRGRPAGGHLGLGEVPHSRVPACPHGHPGAGAVFLPSEDVRLLLPCKGDIMYSGKKIRWLVHLKKQPWREIKLLCSLSFYLVWLVSFATFF